MTLLKPRKHHWGVRRRRVEAKRWGEIQWIKGFWVGHVCFNHKHTKSDADCIGTPERKEEVEYWT